ncbi:MAG: glycerate kinase [Burkholderiaceae bacterium]|jgi:hydroxypyruvate reductase|nr:glycerate kinase [Burkholderiaceae bacterium]
MSAPLQPRPLLERLFHAAVRRALPSEVLRPHLPPPPRGRTLVLGAGKAAAAMAQALEAVWPADAPLTGLVVTRYGHQPLRPQGLAQRIDVVEAAHPVPDQASHDAALRLLALAGRGWTRDDLVICLLSGGGSSLATLPVEGLDLAGKQRIHRALLECGADIHAINGVRKHLSRIKGGRIATACWPAPVITLAISDVPGDDIGTIASGPTVADATDCAQALHTLDRYGIALPWGVRAALAAGTLETPKPGDPRLAGHEAHLVATPGQALEAAAEEARQQGIEVRILGDAIEGESRVVGMEHAALVQVFIAASQERQTPLLLLSGGETTVTLAAGREGRTRGRGGRAGEFCLGLTAGLRGRAHVWALAADTDGIDGVEDNAGAFVGPDTLARAQALGLSLNGHMERNDAYGYFAALGDLFITGPTHTNVNDFRAILIDGPART